MGAVAGFLYSINVLTDLVRICIYFNMQLSIFDTVDLLWFNLIANIIIIVCIIRLLSPDRSGKPYVLPLIFLFLLSFLFFCRPKFACGCW